MQPRLPRFLRTKAPHVKHARSEYLQTKCSLFTLMFFTSFSQGADLIGADIKLQKEFTVFRFYLRYGPGATKTDIHVTA